MAKITVLIAASSHSLLLVRFLALCFMSSLFQFGCQTQTSVSGVWREVPSFLLNEPSDMSSEQLNTDTNQEIAVLYELSLGQYGERVAGVSVRYQQPSSESLAIFDQADRCDCSFVVQGLIEELENPQEDRLLFVANGLRFSIYTPQKMDHTNSICLNTAQECKRIFDLEQVDKGAALEGHTWCLDNPKETNRFIRFESTNGIVEDSCEAE